MIIQKKDISFTVFESGQEHQLHTHWGEYRDLRALLNDHLYLEDFGQCGGMGRCATCTVSVIGLTGDALKMKRNEPVTLAKAGSVFQNQRLSCQIPINEDLTNVVVKILNDL